MGVQQLQMSWQPSLLSQKRKNGPPLGLRNLGNSCYLNSVLQCLTYTPPLANFCLRRQHSSLCDSSDADRKRDCPFCLLEKRIARSLSSDLQQDAPAKIQSCLRIFSEQFRGGRQEDAHEFLRYVIDACHNTCLRLKKLRRIGNGSTGAGSGGGGASVVKEIFGGALQSQPEVLDGSNKYKCESCKKLVPARKQMSVLQAPNILVIQLKRFEGIFGGKIDKAVAFEEVLVLSSFMCKTSKDLRPEYKLFGTIVHSGFSPESGHYYAYIKDATGRWYCCNDTFVSLSTMQEVLSEKVYILFFSRTNQRPESANIPLSSTISNGVKSRDCNGHDASKSLKPALHLKEVHAKPCEQPSRKDLITASKADKVPSHPQIKFNIIGTSNSKRPSISNGNGKVFKNQSMEANGGVEEASRLEILEKAKSTLVNKNGLDNNGNVEGIDSQRTEESVSTKGSGNYPAGKLDTNGSRVTRDELPTGRESDHRDAVNDGMEFHDKVSGSKRRPSENSCILLAEDAQSRGKVEDLKEVLAKEASSVLRSCGWSDKVYNFMGSGKRLRTQEAGTTPLTRDELRKLLIVDAKSTFISKIPESLKEDLIKRLQSFSKDK
ncbi:ubiquitin carboxyl-terminal hydrolase 25 isoform X2 [Morus notabilis]|uniref:ubiquitin carboxyl-terminal hydrolase 25 isoform X2 n=1 Tax=Morus notabilis TaxID=981085 RepID=UPI000CECEF09|nr:ubiquitin carboxyl-terminal hydrolase 25 isoform X2 [Morus notabilis]